MNARARLVGLTVTGILAAVGCTVKKTSSSSNGTSGAGGASSSSQLSTGVTQTSTTPASSTVAQSVTNTVSSGSGTFVAHCNPVTNTGCATGEACDAEKAGTFECFAPPNDTPVCKPCDNMAGPFCQGGYACGAANGCAKYCCDDGDCGSGTCMKTNANGDALWPGVSVGLCLDGAGNAACDVPAVAPSMGACITDE